ncbi:MAG: DUF3052 family protein [Chloroflexi bacterium]|nr:DUF3052 family protein [Chloroflexota bacterium]
MKQRPPERDYSHRGVLDKLGIKPGHAVAVDALAGPLDAAAREGLLEQTGRPLAREDEPADVVLAVVDATVDLAAVLRRWRGRLDPGGGIWLLTPKRRFSGYVAEGELIAAGRVAGLVDNKVCSVSDATSAMRFVVRKEDRPKKNV